MNITIHSTSSIAGCLVEIQHRDNRILIDTGVTFSSDTVPLPEPAHENVTGEDALVEKGIHPRISGLYKWDTLRKPVDAILIPHRTFDYAGFSAHLLKKVRLLMGTDTWEWLQSEYSVSPGDSLSEHIYVFKSNKTFHIGGFAVTAYFTDHSENFCHSYFIQASDRRLIYSGDVTGKSRKTAYFKRLLENIPGDIDAVLLEGASSGLEHTDSIVTTIHAIKPRFIIPVHSTHPERLGELFPETNIAKVGDNIQITLE